MSISERLVKAPRRKWVIGCSLVGVLVLGLVGFAVLQVVDYPVVALRAEKVAAEYRAAGLPWVAEDLEFESSPGVDEKFLLKLIQMNRSDLVIDGLPDGNRKEPDWKIVAAEIDRLAPELKPFEEMARAERVYIPRRWDDGDTTTIRDAAVLKEAGRRFCNRAELKARNGDLEGAFVDLRLANGVARVCGQQPVTMLQLVGVAVYSKSCRTALDIAAYRKNDTKWVKRIRQELESWNVVLDFDAALRGEQYMYLSIARNVQKARLTEQSSESDSKWKFRPAGLKSGVGSGFWRKAIVTRQMEYNLALERARTDEPDSAILAMLKFDLFQRRVIESRKASWELVHENYSSDIFSQVAHSIDTSRIFPHLSVLALACWEFRQSKGRYPSDLSEVGVDIVLDPAVGQPVLMAEEQGSILIYHRGPNRLDDGGIRNKVGVDDLGVWFPQQPKAILNEQEPRKR
jgi:hypothetical protein